MVKSISDAFSIPHTISGKKNKTNMWVRVHA